MASDLSTLIQEGLCNTINGLIAKKTTLKETTKAVKEDMASINLLEVESSFEFDNITSTWSFYIPAYSASYIFNQMLGDQSDPVLEIDDDIADAMREFISNFSGALTTSINGEKFEDLGQSKFVIGNTKKLSSDSLKDFEDIYKFSLDVEGTNIFLFIKYDDLILPFLSIISSSKAPQAQQAAEEPAKEEQKEDDSPLENEEVTPPKDRQKEKEEQFLASKEKVADKKNSNDQKPEEEQFEQENQPQENKNSKKLKIIVIAVASLLFITLAAGAVMYFTGMFDPKEEQKQETPKQETKEEQIQNSDVDLPDYTQKEKIPFNIEQINKERVNSRLEALTKYDILNEEEIQAQEAAEKERLYALQKEQELIEFAAENKEEDIFTRKDDDPTRKIDIKTNFQDTDLNNDENQDIAKAEEHTDGQALENDQKTVSTAENETDLQNTENQTSQTTVQKKEESKLKFVIVETLKYKLYNELILKVTDKNARISICKNDNGRTAVYIGPFENLDDQSMMKKLIEEQNISDSKTVDLTSGEFDARCNFE